MRLLRVHPLEERLLSSAGLNVGMKIFPVRYCNQFSPDHKCAELLPLLTDIESHMLWDLEEYFISALPILKN